MIGDASNIVARLKSALPGRWFADASPVRDALFAGLAAAHSFLYSLYLYAKQQTRIKTASDGWLDMVAADFFGPAVVRTSGQSDASLLARIIANLFRERATRASVVKVLTELTGRAPKIFEPALPSDTGAYGGPYLGYGLAGGYGSLLLPEQAFVDAYRPLASGIPYIAGYGISTAGYGVAAQGEYAALSMVQGSVQDADIYAAIESVRPVGVTLWTRINS